ncbi:hypothetical protein CB1_001616058 [Camelus ferus]|nr:hypothetical protein CB1_001616058 [Camelus ferus]
MLQAGPTLDSMFHLRVEGTHPLLSSLGSWRAGLDRRSSTEGSLPRYQPSSSSPVPSSLEATVPEGCPGNWGKQHIMASGVTRFQSLPAKAQASAGPRPQAKRNPQLQCVQAPPPSHRPRLLAAGHASQPQANPSPAAQAPLASC